jgi:nitroreductase
MSSLSCLMDDPTPSNLATREIERVKPLAEIMWDRRATRHFAPDPIPDDQLDEIFALASQAPSGYNLQPWRFVVIRDAERRARLCHAALDQEKVREAPVVLVAFARRDAWDEYAQDIFVRAAETGARSADGIAEQKREALDFISTLPIQVWLNRHVMIAFTYLMLAAESLGWDTAPMEGFDANAVKKVAELPEDAEVVALLALGRHLGEASPHPGRLPVERLFFAERYGHPWQPVLEEPTEPD